MKISITIILVLTAFFATAAPIDSLENIYNLKEVVITSTRTPLQLKDTPVITRVISSREIEKSGAKTIQQVLENELAGVEFHQAGYGSSISFQGLDARYVLFLIDGERISGETYGNIDYSRISLPNVERIEIVRGASSVLYGSSAMGAVVNIITKQQKQDITISASARYAGMYQKEDVKFGGVKTNSKLDIPNINADLYMGFRFKRLSSQTTIAYSGVDAYNLKSTEQESRHYDALTIMQMTMMGPKTKVVNDTTLLAPIDTTGLSVSGWKNITLNQRFDYKFSDKVSAYASVNYYSKNRYDSPESINTGSANGENWTSETNAGYNFKTGVDYKHNDRNMFLLSYSGDTYKRSNDSLQYVIPKQRHVYHAPRLLWIGSIGNYNRMTAGAEFISEELNFDLNPDGYNKKRDLNTISAYVQDEIKTNIGFSFVAGVRFDNNSDFGFNITPKASVKYSVGNCSLRANYSQGYRNPSLKELHMKYLIPMGTMGGNTYVVGNPDLKPEYNQYISATAEYLNGFTNISITAFKSFFRDKIDVRREAVSQTLTHLVYDNISKSTFSGIEIIARARIIKGLFVTGNYNYIAQTEDAPLGSTQYIFVSPHTATLQLDYGFMVGKCDMGINIGGRFVGAKKYEDMMVIVEYPKSGPPLPTVYRGNYTARHSAYTLWNATVSAGLSDNIKIYAGIDNIFNYKADVINFNSCISPRRTGFVKLAFNIGK